MRRKPSLCNHDEGREYPDPARNTARILPPLLVAHVSGPVLAVNAGRASTIQPCARDRRCSLLSLAHGRFLQLLVALLLLRSCPNRSPTRLSAIVCGGIPDPQVAMHSLSARAHWGRTLDLIYRTVECRSRLCRLVLSHSSYSPLMPRSVNEP
jgi:hypothetical protein